MFRLNFSHGTHKYHLKTLNTIRIAMTNLDKTVAILQDISGPKVRVGELKENFELKKNDILTILSKEIVGYKKSDNEYVVSINYPNILKKIKVDEYIYLYDGIIRAKVINVNGEVKARIENNGTLSSKKC